MLLENNSLETQHTTEKPNIPETPFRKDIRPNNGVGTSFTIINITVHLHDSTVWRTKNFFNP